MKIEAKRLEDFISRLKIVSARPTNKDIKPVGKIIKEYPDGCGTNYDISYFFKYNAIGIKEQVLVELKENIRIEHDDKETPQSCIDSKLEYIQNQVKN